MQQENVTDAASRVSVARWCGGPHYWANGIMLGFGGGMNVNNKEVNVKNDVAVTAMKVSGVIVCLFVFVWFFATDRVGEDKTVATQVLMSVVLFVLGYWYYRFRQLAPKVLLGVLAISAALVSNWFEIGKVATDTAGRSERAIFVFAAIALTAHGFKQLKEARSGKKTDEDE